METELTDDEEHAGGDARDGVGVAPARKPLRLVQRLGGQVAQEQERLHEDQPHERQHSEAARPVV